ncbi:MAG: TonB-dependent receptor [Saprospiraceae bacterium]
MNLFRTRIILINLFIYCASLIHGQASGFDSFISRISKQYKIDLALAPELLPALDSIRNLGLEKSNIEDLLHQLLDDTNISYQIVDGNKLMLRRESPFVVGNGSVLLRGKIVDVHDGLPLPYAAITLKGTNRGTFTDENGYFTLPVNDTTGTIVVSYLGFSTASQSIQAFVGHVKKVALEVSTNPLKQVIIIVPYQQMLMNQEVQSIDLRGYQFFSSDQLLNVNSEQLINQLTAYSQFSSDQGIRLRGSDAENSLVIMDGLPVYDPYHFYNIFSAFNGHYFSSVRLYKNNMPVEYGGRIDGLISIDSDYDDPGSKLILDTDLLLSSISADVDISSKVRFTAGGRISHTSLLNKALRDSTSVSNFTNGPGKFKDQNEWSSSQQPTFNFYDINLGLRAYTGKASNVKLSYFKNQDRLETNIHTNFETTEHGIDIISIKQTIQNVDKWQNEGAAADFQSTLRNTAIFHLNGFISTFEKSSGYSSVTDEFQHNMYRSGQHAGLQNSHLMTAGIKAFIVNTLSGGQKYKIGIDLQRHEINLLANENNTTYLTQEQQEFEATLFGEYQVHPLDKFELTGGGRLTYLNSTSSFYPQPHVQINFAINDHWILKSAYSKNIQAIQQLTLENRFGREIEFLALSQPEEGYPVLKSDKYMLGAGYTTSHFNFDVEFYYKKLDGLINVRALRPDPSFHDHSPPGEFYRLFSGDGWTDGMDVMMAYKKDKFQGSVSYTLSKISERYDLLFNGNSFSPEEDRRHQVKLSADYKIGKFTPSALVNYKTKAPYLSLVRLDGRDGIGMADQGNSFRYLPAYFSLDLGLDYAFNCFHQPAQIGISLINATNHKNIRDLEHIGRVSRDEGMGGLYLTQETELLGRTFNVHFRYLLN